MPWFRSVWFSLLLGVCLRGNCAWALSDCAERVIDALFERGELPQFTSRAEFLHWRNTLLDAMGLSPELVLAQDRRLSPKVLELMRGIRAPSGHMFGATHVSGGWGQDYVFAPLDTHWDRVRGNLGPLSKRMEERLHLNPILRRQLFRSDWTSIPDSAWVLAESKVGNETTTASVKTVFFDVAMTPDGPWPRYSIEFPLDDSALTLYRRPRITDRFAIELLESGRFTLKSSLDYWGLLPLEVHTGFRVSEHDPKRYPPQYHQLFSDAFLLAHKDLMEYVLDGYGRADVADRLKTLMSFREHMIPKEALTVAELSRFNIPPKAARSARAQLSYGWMVLTIERPIETFYLLAPRPKDKNRPTNTFPQTEVAFIQPGYEWLRRAVEAAIREMDPPVAEYLGAERDLLRESYEELGFEVIHTLQHCFGTPNGAHVMRVSRKRLLDRLTAYQLENPKFLTPGQLEHTRLVRHLHGLD